MIRESNSKRNEISKRREEKETQVQKNLDLIAEANEERKYNRRMHEGEVFDSR